MASGFTTLGTQDPSAVKGLDLSTQGVTAIVASPQNFSAVVHNTAMDAYVNAFHVVFLTAAPVTALGFILALSLREVPLRTSHDYAAARDEAAGEAIG